MVESTIVPFFRMRPRAISAATTYPCVHYIIIWLRFAFLCGIALEYGTDKWQHSKTRPDGTEQVYIISPYQIAANKGKYYLICNYDKYDDISNYRLDRITELKILDEPSKPFEHLKWANGRTLDLATYMKEHPYMYASDNVRAVFRSG